MTTLYQRTCGLRGEYPIMKRKGTKEEVTLSANPSTCADRHLKVPHLVPRHSIEYCFESIRSRRMHSTMIQVLLLAL